MASQLDPACASVRLGVLLVAIAVAGCSDETGSEGPRGARAVPAVEVVQAQFGSLPLEYRVTGTVRAANQVAVFPEISATVVDVAVETGQRVELGDPLVYLRDAEFGEQVEQAAAALEVAQAEARRQDAELREVEARLDRTRQLAAKNFQSQQELDALEAEVAAAGAGLEQARARVLQAEAVLSERRESLRRTVVRAPVAGNVGRRNVEVGMRVSPNSQLFMVGSLDLMRVEISIPDAMVDQIEAGQPALIRPRSSTSTVVPASVTRISPFIRQGSFSAAAEIDVANPDGLLRPGMFVTVDILYGESVQATLVPTSAIFEDPATGQFGIVTAPSLGLEIPVSSPESASSDSGYALLEATPMAFEAVEIVARGSDAVGVRGIDPNAWVVVVGQHLLSGIGNERVAARARIMSWERLVSLQQLQDEDLLRQFMAKQERESRRLFAPGVADTSTSG